GRLRGGARVIDGGCAAPGVFGAGRGLSEICTGGLADIATPPVPIGGETWPGIRVWTDHPAVSCMASQYAGWAIQVGKYFAMGSGPLRAHARVEEELFAKLGYVERAERGVLVLETRTAPTDEVATWVAQKAGLAQDGHARVRREQSSERDRHGAPPTGREERSPGDRPHQRLHSVRRPSALTRPGR